MYRNCLSRKSHNRKYESLMTIVNNNKELIFIYLYIYIHIAQFHSPGFFFFLYIFIIYSSLFLTFRVY